MKIITINLPKSYTLRLEKMSQGIGVSRSELIREAIKDFLVNELLFIEEIKKEDKRKLISRFFDYCINCERKLHHTSSRNHFFHKTIEIFKLKFCCSCFKLFKDKTLDEFPADLIDKIKKKIKAFKKHKELSNNYSQN